MPSATGRLNEVLAVAGFPAGLFLIGQSFKTAVYGEENSLITTTALDYVQTLTETEPGLIFQGPDGNLYALSRQYVIGQGAVAGLMNPARAFTSQGIFGDTSGATYRFLGKNLSIGQDDQDVWNDIQAQSSRPGTPAPTLQSFTQTTDSRLAASAGQYGDRTLQGLTSLLFLYDSDALLVAEWYGVIYCAAQVRPQSITIDATFNLGANLAQMLGRTLYDQVTIEYQGMAGSPAFSGGSQFTQNSLIESIAHDVDFGSNPEAGPSWETTWSLSPYEISLALPGQSSPPLAVSPAAPIELGVWMFGSAGQLLL